MHLKEPYQARTIRYLERFEADDWQLKLYSILYGDKTADANLLNAAKETALSFLPRPAVTPNHYGLGFISVHQGKSYDFVSVAYWTYETELRHQSYMRPSSTSSSLEAVKHELSTDVWDLRLLAFERDAWLETILKSETPNPQAYLEQTLNEKL